MKVTEAYIKVGGADYRLCCLISSVMDSLLKRPKTKNVRGIPVYFDMKGRVWPLPEDEAMKVDFREVER